MKRILASLVLAAVVLAVIPACGSGASTPSDNKVAKYASNLAAAVAALAENDAVKAERAAFALTLLDGSRCEGHAALAAALVLQKKQSESKAEFELAKSNAGGSGKRLVELLAYSTAAEPRSVDPATMKGAAGEKWQSTLADAIAALLAGDAVKAERLAYAVTQLEDGRCEVDAVLALALARQSKQSEAKSAFDAAKAKARGSDVGMVELLLAVESGRVVAPPRVTAAGPAPTPTLVAPPTPVPPKPADSKLALDWCEVVAADPDPAVVTDAEARQCMIETRLPWKVRDRKTGIVMLLCPPGEFMMGSPASEEGHSGDEAQHRVSITKAFYLSETEVPQEAWQKVMGTNPSSFSVKQTTQSSRSRGTTARSSASRLGCALRPSRSGNTRAERGRRRRIRLVRASRRSRRTSNLRARSRAAVCLRTGGGSARCMGMFGSGARTGTTRRHRVRRTR